MARKLNKNLLALGSAAIVSIYAVGLARTATTPSVSAGSITTTPANAASATQPPLADTATAIAQAIATASATPAAAAQTGTPPATSTAAANAYKDGTYTGIGISRLGNISVAVTVQGGKITDVRISGSTTHYPTSRISQLPGEVVAAQSTSVKLVSGATYSSQAFKQAVTQALAQAATGA